METYEKKYKDLVEAVKQLQKANPSDEGIQNWVNDNIPELRESEDEKIRETLIGYFKNYKTQEEIGIKTFFGIPTDDIIAWLEKQKSEEINVKALLTADRLAAAEMTGRLKERKDIVENPQKYGLEKQDEQKPTECIKFSNEFENQISHLLVSVLNGEHEYNEGFVKYVAQSLLGYAKNELKPTGWSEEDEEIIKIVISICEHVVDTYSLSEDTNPKMATIIPWLKSIKERVQLKQRWNEKDEQIVHNIRRFIEKYAISQSAVDVNGDLCEKIYIDADNWLKNIKQRIGG